MYLSFNKLVQSDVDKIIDHYELMSVQLVDRFFRDMEIRLLEIKNNPTRFPKDQNFPGYRKVRLRKFPYQIVYKIISTQVRILVIKHEKKRPNFGMQRS